jgi:splicing factor 3B subunit 2
VALNPEELDLDTAAMQAKYDQTMREQQSHTYKKQGDLTSPLGKLREK